MQRRLSLASLTLAAFGAFGALGALGCLPAVEAPMDSGTPPVDAGGGDTAPVVTYTKDVQPILGVKCAPCHTGEGLGGHNIGNTYADALMPVSSLDAMGCWDSTLMVPMTVGACALISIMNGWMPMSMGCFNTPRPDPCVTLDQQAIIAAWVAEGMPQ
jgi:hypothetical protein